MTRDHQDEYSTPRIGPPTDEEMDRWEREVVRQQERSAEWRARTTPMDKAYQPHGNGLAANVQVLSSEPKTATPARPLTDYGNAERLVAGHGAELRYCAAWSRWLTWTGQRWQPDETGEVYRRAKHTTRMIYHEAAETANDERRRAIAAWAKQSESKVRLDAMIALAQSEAAVAVRPAGFDADGWLLNVQNGTLDLRSGDLHPHSPADMIMKLAPVAFDPAATCPTLDRFLADVLPDPDVRAYVQRHAGYSATGSTKEQQLSFWHGSGSNGKSTLVNALLGVLGDYARQAAPNLLVSQHEEHPTALADLHGARLVASIEVGEGKKLAEVLLKQLTGQDRMKARFVCQDYFEWEPTHKIVLLANHKPTIAGTDWAIWRRIHLVPFTVTIADETKDPDLPEKLKAEYPGILRWIVDGCLAWQRQGLGKPEAVRKATADYRHEQDVLADFLEECCTLDIKGTVPVAEVYARYTAWAEAGGERKPLDKRAFGAALKERGFEQDKADKGRRVWLGLKLAAAPSPTPVSAPASGGTGGTGGREMGIVGSCTESHERIPKSLPPTPPTPPTPPDSETCSVCGAFVERYGADGTAFCEQHVPAEAM